MGNPAALCYNTIVGAGNLPLKINQQPGNLSGPDFLFIATLSPEAQPAIEGASHLLGRFKQMLGNLWDDGVKASKSGLKPGSLSNEATRKWYHSQLDSIPSQIDSKLPLRERAMQAFKMRNDIKLQARELMADRAAAKALPAPKTLQDVVRKAYQQGLRGDDVWHYVLGGSQRSNAAVDSALGLTR